MHIIAEKKLTNKKKISRNVGFIKRVKENLDKENLKILYFALIESNILYGLLVWQGMTGEEKNKLLKLQEKFVRFLNNEKKANWKDIEDKYGILRIDILLEYRIGQIMFRRIVLKEFKDTICIEERNNVRKLRKIQNLIVLPSSRKRKKVIVSRQ